MIPQAPGSPAAGTAVPRADGVPSLRAVLFDAGLTLIRAATPAEEVAAEALAQRGVQVRRPDLRTAMDRAEVQFRSQWLRDDWWASERKVRSLFVAAYRDGLQSVGVAGGDRALAATLADAVYDSYQDTRHWGLYPDVLPTLEALRGAGIEMGIVSDWGHGLVAIVLELELGRFLDFLVVSSHLGVSKPDPRVFQMALNRIAVPPAAAIYVGDTYVKDVMGARAAGLTPVLLDRRGTAPMLDCACVRDLTNLLPLVGLAPAARAVQSG